jgi:nucleoside-diphosphate-sugar epimerase
VRILFTGASSFTGCWFVGELAAAGHEVTAVFRRRPEEYSEPLRRRRVQRALESCRGVYGCAFGDDAFLALVREQGPWDLLCHHGADVTNYKSPDFDVPAAVSNNAHRLPEVLAAMSAAGCRRVLLTGSVFECGEGAGSEGLPAFSPYGLSKALTAEMFRFYAARAGLALGKFVIPNPFGPFEEPRFTAYLMKSWFAGAIPSVQTPAYVRDNIHVSLLARAYARFAEELPAGPAYRKLNPSGYIETQGAFAQRFGREMARRLDMPCAVELKQQTAFDEPRIRINTDPLDAAGYGWDESRAWDEIAEYYRRTPAR